MFVFLALRGVNNGLKIDFIRSFQMHRCAPIINLKLDWPLTMLQGVRYYCLFMRRVGELLALIVSCENYLIRDITTTIVCEIPDMFLHFRK